MNSNVNASSVRPSHTLTLLHSNENPDSFPAPSSCAASEGYEIKRNKKEEEKNEKRSKEKTEYAYEKNKELVRNHKNKREKPHIPSIYSKENERN